MMEHPAFLCHRSAPYCSRVAPGRHGLPTQLGLLGQLVQPENPPRSQNSKYDGVSVHLPIPRLALVCLAALVPAAACLRFLDNVLLGGFRGLARHGATESPTLSGKLVCRTFVIDCTFLGEPIGPGAMS